MSIVYREGHDVDLDQLATLFNSVGWQARAVDCARLRQQLVGAMFVVSAWKGGTLVGFARAISDGATNAYISTVAVLPACQGQGIGPRAYAPVDEWAPGNPVRAARSSSRKDAPEIR